MTREDAIDWLCRLRDDVRYVIMPKYKDQYVNALIYAISSLEQQSCKKGQCKYCEYFELDHFSENYNLITAHEICKKWGKGCKTSQNGYCHMFEERKRNE